MSFPARLERFGSVDSTQRIVREWLDAGVPEVAIAVADEQRAGRGRQGRGWMAPPGAALLLSCGFRPQGLPLSRAWRLAATVCLAMVDAAEETAGLAEGSVGLKWPNDLVHQLPGEGLRKVAGVLGESVAEGDRLASAVVGIGINADWPAETFPNGLAGSMTSLREMAGRAVDREALLTEFLVRLEQRYGALLQDRFDSAGWAKRQRTTGAQLEVAVGERTLRGRGDGLDAETGALLLESSEGLVRVGSGEVTSCRVLLP